MLHILRLDVSNCSVTHCYTKFLFWPLLNFKTVIVIRTVELIIDIRIITYGNPINGTALIKINFARGCGYYIILLVLGIIRYCIVLHYLPTVLRLLCAL